MSSSITTFIATALVLFTLGQAVANSAKQAAQEQMGVWGVELPWGKR